HRQASLLSVSGNRQRRRTANQPYEFASPHGATRGSEDTSIVPGPNDLAEGAATESLVAIRYNVRFGSKADICTAPAHVRFTPNSDRESRHPQPVMSALPPKRTCAVH